MKKVLVWILLVGILLCSTQLCIADEKRVVTMMFGTATTTMGLDAVSEWIEQTYGIALEVELIPSGTEGANLVKTRIAAGELSDILHYNSGAMFNAIDPVENFIDLTQYEFYDAVSEDFKKAVTVGDGAYGVPVGTATGGGWLYNKSIYTQLGLSVPHTWSELMSNCEVIKQAGYTPVIGSFGNSWTAQYILLEDYYNIQSVVPDFAERFSSHEATFTNTPVALASFEKLGSFAANDYLNADADSNTYEYAMTMLANGDGVHYPNSTAALTTIAKNYPDKVDNIGYFGQPGDDAQNHGTAMWLPYCFAVNKDGEKSADALEWIEHFCSVTGQTIYNQAITPEGPVLYKGVEMPDTVQKGVLDMMEYYNSGKYCLAMEFITPVKAANSSYICVECMSGITNAQEAAIEYDKDIEKQAKQLGLAGW